MQSAVSGSVAALGGAVALGLVVDGGSGNATITMTGPADVWFAVGFGAQLMADAPYTIVVEPGAAAAAGGDGAAAAAAAAAARVSERRLARYAPGSALAPSVEVLSQSVDAGAGTRTVVLRRGLAGATSRHFSFDATKIALDFIAATGTAAAFGPHGAAPHGPATLALWPAQAAPVCLCNLPAPPFGQGTGAYTYLPTGGGSALPLGRCFDQPRGDLIAQRNPTCDFRTYVGGQSVCKHGWHLLDADQEVPWADQPLVYYKKFRVYFQDYNASRHVQIGRADWGIGAGSNHDEYDVPRCAAGTPAAQCRHNITGTWMPVAAGGTPRYMAAVHHHCHAPTCLRVDLYNNDTGELICRAEPVYGGTGGYVADVPAFDEAGYIGTPPCMWGSPNHGLKPPPLMNGVTIHVVATTNNTYGHHGEMALPQIMLADGPLPDLEQVF